MLTAESEESISQIDFTQKTNFHQNSNCSCQSPVNHKDNDVDAVRIETIIILMRG